MPIWGDAFRMRQGSEAAGASMGGGLTESQVHSKIDRLVKYVQSIQVQ
jgi:hypothetical protein